MMTCPPRESGSLKKQLPLDNGLGPATLLSSQRENDIVENVLNQAFAQPHPQRRHLHWRAAVVFVISFGVMGVAAGYGITKVVTYVIELRRKATPQKVEKTHHPRRSKRALHPLSYPLEEGLDATAPTPETDGHVVSLKAHRARRTQRGHKVKAQDLLAQANLLRAQRRWLAAERLYRRVVKKYPKSDQAYSAAVAAAYLRLEQLDDPTSALRLLRIAQKDRGHQYLLPEIRYGIAECFKRLGNREAEIGALEIFLRAHPRSPLNKKAAQRLHTLTRDLK